MKGYSLLIFAILFFGCNRYKHDGPPIIFFSISEPDCQSCELYINNQAYGPVGKVMFEQYHSLDELLNSGAAYATFEDGTHDVSIINQVSDTVIHFALVFENGQQVSSTSYSVLGGRVGTEGSAKSITKKSDNVITMDIFHDVTIGYKENGETKHREKKF